MTSEETEELNEPKRHATDQNSKQRNAELPWKQCDKMRKIRKKDIL